MTQHAFSTSRHRAAVRRQPAHALSSLFFVGLAGLLTLGGCNKAAAPAAPDTTTAGQPAPPPPAPAESTPSAAPSSAAAAPSAMAAAPMARAVPSAPIAPKEYTVAAGTPIVVRIGQTISSKASNVGDSFSGVLAQSVVTGGVSVIRAGAPVTGTVVAAKGQGRFKGSGDLGIALSRVGPYAVTTAAFETAAKGKGKRSAAFIGGGGGGGALIGGLAGGGKGALIGGLLGAGGGAAGAALTGNKDITIPAETVVSFKLTAPVTVTQDRSKKSSDQ